MSERGKVPSGKLCLKPHVKQNFLYIKCQFHWVFIHNLDVSLFMLVWVILRCHTKRCRVCHKPKRMRSYSVSSYCFSRFCLWASTCTARMGTKSCVSLTRPVVYEASHHLVTREVTCSFCLSELRNNLIIIFMFQYSFSSGRQHRQIFYVTHV